MATRDFAQISQMMTASVLENITAQNVVFTRKLVGFVGTGYMTGDHYDVHFCDDVQENFNERSGNALVLAPEWRRAHKGDTVEGFIAEASLEAWRQANHRGPGA